MKVFTKLGISIPVVLLTAGLLWAFTFSPGSANAQFDPPENLTADVNLYNVELMWEAPPAYQLEEIAYDDGTAETSFWVGPPTTTDQYLGLRLTMPEAGTLKEIAILTRSPNGSSFNNIIVCANNAGVPNLTNTYASFGPTVISYTTLNWLDLTLSTPVALASGTSFWILVNWPNGNVDPNGPFIGADNTVLPTENRNYWSNVPGTWNLWTDHRFMMRAYYSTTKSDYAGSGLQIIESNNPADLTIPVISTANPVQTESSVSWIAPVIKAGTKDLTGYNVFRDGAMINYVTDEEYVDMDLAPGMYEYYVTAVYDDGESVPSNTVSAEIVPITSEDCENFDLLTVGGYVSGQIGGLWTTWGGSPGTAEDALVSDMYSVSPGNSMLIQGTTDCLQLFDIANLTSGAYVYSHNIYVPTGKTGYWNLQKDIIPGAEWGFQVMYDDDGLIYVDAALAGAVIQPYAYDTWYHNEVIVDIDNDWCQFFIDGSLVVEYQWTLGTFGTAGANTLGGANYYANPGTVSGTPPGAHFDDVCFMEYLPFEDWCEDFDALTVGGLVADQLGGMWTTWSGTSADDATVSDMYSNSPGNSFVVDAGAVDLVLKLAEEPITSGKWLYSQYIYVPTGSSGYFNVQTDPTPGVAWNLDLYFDDGGTGSFDGQSTETFTYSQDTWFMVEINYDLDNGYAQVLFDGEQILQFENTLSIGGIDYYGANTGGAPGAYHDDVCFGAGWTIDPPVLPWPTNLTGPETVVINTDFDIMWDAPGGGGGTEELIYDNDVSTGAYSYNGYTMATQMSPAGACKVLAMKFHTTIQAGANDFNATIFGWAGTQPGTDIIYEENVTAIDEDWLEVDISAQNITFDGDFAVGFGSVNATTFLSYDAALNNGRSWDFNNATPSWASWSEAYLIRAIVEYTDGSIAEIGNDISTPTVVKSVNNSVHPTDYSEVTIVKPIDNQNNQSKALLGYNVYRKFNTGSWQLQGFVTETMYTGNVPIPGAVYTYRVTAVYDEGESDPSNEWAIDAVVGVEEYVSNATQLYPNPATNAVNISSDFNMESVTVYNFAGQVVLTQKINNYTYRVNTSNLDAGIYLFQIQTEEGRIAKRVVIE